MVPPRSALAQSESKARLFQRLGLDGNNKSHQRVYAMMKAEAVEGRRRMTESSDVLVPSLRGGKIEPPYSNSQISETVTHREVLRIYRFASPETKAIYDLGRDTARIEEENWVIRWMLWHVFRYRDSRNRNRQASPRSAWSPTPSNDRGDSRVATSGPAAPPCRFRFLFREAITAIGVIGVIVLLTNPVGGASSTNAHRESHYWDPVRNEWCIK